MRLFTLICLMMLWAATPAIAAGSADSLSDMNGKPKSSGGGSPPMNVSADQSLEWYQDKNLYVARGNAKAVRGNLTVNADVMTAHSRPQSKLTPSQKAASKSGGKDSSGPGNGGDIDLMTAEGNVHVVDGQSNIYGDKAVYDLDKHQMVMTGRHLVYKTPKETVTAKDSLEYYEERKIAVARGNAVADSADRHVEGDVLTAVFRDEPNGSSQLDKMMATGHVKVITKTDVSSGDHGTYDAGSNMAVLNGNVKITRPDNTELNGDVGEVNFNNNQSRLLNDGQGRVRALLPAKSTDGVGGSKPAASGTDEP